MIMEQKRLHTAASFSWEPSALSQHAAAEQTTPQQSIQTVLFTLFEQTGEVYTYQVA